MPPYVIATLPDNSLLVGTGRAPNYSNSTGQLIRLLDPTDHGAATLSQVLYSGLPGSVTLISRFGNLFSVPSNSPMLNPVITLLEAGPLPSSAVTKVG